MDLVLLTGFPGFIGRRLASRLLETDANLRVLALVEERMIPAAKAAAAEIDANRIELLAGDIAAPRLGLDDADYERLRTEVRRVFHLAAIYDLAVPLQIAQRVNVEGTGNVIDLCATSTALERFVYVSTAYVAGMRRASSTSTSSAWARSSRTTTSRPSSRPRCGSVSTCLAYRRRSSVPRSS